MTVILIRYLLLRRFLDPVSRRAYNSERLSASARREHGIEAQRRCQPLGAPARARGPGAHAAGRGAENPGELLWTEPGRLQLGCELSCLLAVLFGHRAMMIRLPRYARVRRGCLLGYRLNPYLPRTIMGSSLRAHHSPSKGREITQALMPPMPIESLPARPDGKSQGESKTRQSWRAAIERLSWPRSRGVGKRRPSS